MSASVHRYAGAGLVGVASVIVALVSCQAYSPPNPDYEFHETFTRGPGHRNAGCDACHVVGADWQRSRGLGVPEGEWVAQLQSSCLGCHPRWPAGAVAAPPVEDCTPGVPFYDSEYCLYSVRTNHGPGSGREGECAECHPAAVGQSVSRPEEAHCDFRFTRAPCEPATPPTDTDNPDTDDTDLPTPPQLRHADPPLSDRFPLLGGHAEGPDGPTCSDCHQGATEADERGKGEYCGSCHGRVRDSATLGVDHYPPPRAGWTDERERDCMACHVDVDLGGNILWPTAWTEVQENHEFLVPHHTVEDYDAVPPVPTAEPAWKRQCWSCHNEWSWSGPINGTDNQTGDAQDTRPAMVYMDFDNVARQTLRSNCTDGCHAQVDPGGGPIDVTTHFASQQCVECHNSAGPDDNQ